MKRRDFLLAGGALALGGAGVGLWRLRASAPSPSVAAPAAGGSSWALPFPSDSEVLRAVADAVVPPADGLPGASESGLVPALERWVRRAPARRRLYAEYGPAFERAVRAEVPFDGAGPRSAALAELLERWYREFRAPGAGVPARFFEQLRRDLLRLYYASPAGWASVGYAGPPQRAHPHRAPGAAES